jgi:hypothetical protein
MTLRPPPRPLATCEANYSTSHPARAWNWVQDEVYSAGTRDACARATAQDGGGAGARTPERSQHRARLGCPGLASVGADRGFAGERVGNEVTQLGGIAFVPLQRMMLPDGEPRTSAQAAALAARAHCKIPQGIWAYERRMCDAEGGCRRPEERARDASRDPRSPSPARLPPRRPGPSPSRRTEPGPKAGSWHAPSLTPTPTRPQRRRQPNAGPFACTAS